VLSIEKSLEEVCRVLVPQGRYLVWLGSIPGAAAYDPKRTDFTPADHFHLFHFDRKWIEPIFAKYFEFLDVTIIPQVGFDHVFYCLTPK
jgi:ubiquinone/menaquinone biosynthesis C-methylase UbiE